MGHFAPFVSGDRKPVPERSFRMLGTGTFKRQAEHGVLARPLDWRMAQSGDANTAWQSTCDSGPDQIGRQEGERDGHVDLAYTAPFSLRDAFRICVCASDKFIKPVAAAGNRCNQGRAGLRPYRTSVLRRDPHRRKNLPPPR